MASPNPARSRRPLTRGVPTQSSPRTRLLTAGAALLLAAALASYPATLGWRAAAIGGSMGGVGVALVLAALIGFWEDGLIAGPALLLAGYVAVLAAGHHAHDAGAPILAAGLLALVDLGSWSLELRECRETPPLHHLRTLLALTLGSLAVSAVVLAAGSVGSGAGIALWIVGAAAAAALLTLIRAHPGGRALGQSMGGSKTSRSSSSQPE